MVLGVAVFESGDGPVGDEKGHRERDLAATVVEAVEQVHERWTEEFVDEYMVFALPSVHSTCGPLNPLEPCASLPTLLGPLCCP